ncbi:MAG: hypothetical protein EAX96_07750 [Candidatus Lokiarchaeota archaeon]|nr:hypothetical protein [Candidatus Lokiarchaeota archaeon]
MVIRDFHKKPRSLCPRCGGPMIEEKDEESGQIKFKKCPACGYITGSGEPSEPVGIKFRMDEKIEDKKEKILIFHQKGDNIIKATNLDSDTVALVADKNQNIIFVWKGKFTSPGERYRAGTAATRLKSSERMYGAQTIMVDEGEEPKNFPDLKGAAKETEEKAKKEAEEEAKRKAEEEAKRKVEDEKKKKLEMKKKKIKKPRKADLEKKPEKKVSKEIKKISKLEKLEDEKVKAEEEAKKKAEEKKKVQKLTKKPKAKKKSDEPKKTKAKIIEKETKKIEEKVKPIKEKKSSSKVKKISKTKKK